MGKLSTRGYGQLRDFPGILAPSLFQKRDLLVSCLCETFFEVLATICLLFKSNMQGRRCLEMVIQRDKSLSFYKFDNLRGFQIKHQKLISETKSVRKILSETKKTEEYKHLDEKSSERVKNSIWFKITPLATSLLINLLYIPLLKIKIAIEMSRDGNSERQVTVIRQFQQFTGVRN